MPFRSTHHSVFPSCCCCVCCVRQRESNGCRIKYNKYSVSNFSNDIFVTTSRFFIFIRFLGNFMYFIRTDRERRVKNMNSEIFSKSFDFIHLLDSIRFNSMRLVSVGRRQKSRDKSANEILVFLFWLSFLLFAFR